MRKPLSALIVENDEQDAWLLVQELKWGGYEPTWERVEDEASLRGALASPHWEIVFCDYRMPAFNAPQALQIVLSTRRDLPFIIVSGTIGEEIAVESLKAGADDYLLKGRLTRLGSAVERVLLQAKSARKMVEQAALLDQAQDAILVQDLEGAVTFWNLSAARVFGWTAEEMMCRRVQDFLWEEPGQYQLAMAAVARHGEWNGELRLRTRSGVPVLMQARWSLLRDERGEPQSVLVINTDITEKKKLETQFFRAQRMESIGTLASGIAHDLNNVLGPILMAVDLFKLTMRDPRELELLETVEMSARRGADLVRQVLSLGREVEGVRVLIAPAQLIEEVARIAQATFPRAIEVKVTSTPGTWKISGDPAQLHQVLLKLCLNARDAMPQGGKLSIRASHRYLDEHYSALNPEAKPGDYLKMEVQDTGTGMTPEVLEKIFDPFFTTKELGGGTGLGLSTTLTILKRHGGFLEVDSAPGHGTTFQIHLPAHAPPGPDAEAAAELPRGQDELILVVDDEESVRNIMQHTLETFGYRVVLAANGAEAVAEFAKNMGQIAAVITDMMMPVMDGAATIHALTRLDPEVKIIAASGLGAKEAEAQAAGAAMKRFLAKPYTAATLLQTLREVLGAPLRPR